MDPNADHVIKVRIAGEKRFAFLTPKCGTNHLRVHAALMPLPAAKRVAEQLQAINPDCQFVVKSLRKGARHG